MSDTFRTGTEQMLLSTAIDRSIDEMDFSALEGKDVYFDPQYLRGVTDEGYVVSSMRQKLLASGVYLKASRDEATYIVEARAGAVGTNRHDVLIGIPQVNIPSVAGLGSSPSMIPEIPFAKSTQQKGVAKLAVFAYNQVTGQPIWQSGTMPIAADAKDTWVLGTGPFQRGSIYNGTNFAGSRLLLPFAKDKSQPQNLSPTIPVTAAASFPDRPEIIPPGRPQLATKPQPLANSAPPGGFQPGQSPSMPTLPKPQVVNPTSSNQAQLSSGFSSTTYPTMTGTTSAAGQNVTGGNAAAGFLFLGSDKVPYAR